MRPAIRVPQAAALASSGRLEVCRGTTAADETRPRDYVPGARVPAGPWRAPLDEEVRLLTGDSTESVPGETLEILTLTEVRSIRLATPVRVLRDDPGLLTTTRDPTREGRLLGLHVDSQERKPLRDRATSRRLLSFNIAAEPRSLVFASVSVRQIAEHFADAGRHETLRLGDTCATDVALAFLAEVTDCRVFRVRLDPGYGYLGPVQNMVHDGSTEDAESMGMRVCSFAD